MGGIILFFLLLKSARHVITVEEKVMIFRVLGALVFVAFAGAAVGQIRDGGENRYGAFHAIAPDRYMPLTQPEYHTAKQTKLPPEARVVGIVVGDDARCYPLRLITHHHVVNDIIGGQPTAVTYCGMANTALAFELDDIKQELAASGLLGGAMVLRERNTDNLWAQMCSLEVPDNPTSDTLRVADEQALITTWGAWNKAYPNTKVLAPVEEFDFYYEVYDSRPRGYNANPMMDQTIRNHDNRLPPGEDVFGVHANDESIAWPLSELKKNNGAQGTVGGIPFQVAWDAQLQTARLENTPREVFGVRCYWYAWASYFPGTKVEVAP